MQSAETGYWTDAHSKIRRALQCWSMCARMHGVETPWPDQSAPRPFDDSEFPWLNKE